ncbi:MAG: hypothetical protein DLM69_08180 [Candidatus Chloroheliales bacterium]|nr:MAG: hypothetical protein DLM69_08180 [Chloroflexota bacterium]
MYDPRNNPVANNQPVTKTGDEVPASPSGASIPAGAAAGGETLPRAVHVEGGEVIPLPGYGLGESLHGNVEDEAGIFYGDVGVDRDIDATVSHTFSEGHHPLRNPVPDAPRDSDLTYLDDTEVSHQGVATAVQVGAGGAATAAELQDREQGADMGGQRYDLSPNTAVDPPQDLESEGRTATEAGGTLQDSVYGAGMHDQSVSTSAEGPISQMDAPDANIALGAFGMPGGQQLEGEQAARMQPATELFTSAGRPQHSGIIHPRGGTDDGFAYQKQDDQNAAPVEDIARSVGEKYIATSVAYRSGAIHANLGAANLALAIVELRSIGVKDEDIEVQNEGDTRTIQVKVDNLTRPYVEQVLRKYGK